MSESTMEPAQLREAYDRAIAAQAAAESELRSFKTETHFEKQGLTAKHAELYLATNPDGDVTAETVSAFATEYGLSPAATPQPPADPAHMPADGGTPPVERTLVDGPAKPVDASLASVGGAAGTPASVLGSALPAKMSRSEFNKLLQSNPEEAARAYSEGRVERHEANVTVRKVSDTPRL